MTALTLLAVVTGFLALLVTLTWLAENRHPRIDRLAYPKRQWERRVAGFAVFVLVLFAVVATFGQGTPG